MPQVPYHSFPSSGPSFTPAPSLGLSVPAQAFGGASAAAGETVARTMGTAGQAYGDVGRATTGLAHTLGQIGEQTAARAMEFQGLVNDTWAREKDVDVMIELGKAQSEFDQLEGQNAVNALPGHMERIKGIRQQALEDAPNQMAKKLLDAQIARRVGFAIVDSGHKAGTQARAANKQAGAARIETAVATSDPDQYGSSELAEKTIIDEIRRQGQDAGQLPETIDNNIRKVLNKKWLGDVNKVGPHDPEKAQAIFEATQGKMDPETREAALNSVNRNMASKQTRVDAAKILEEAKFDPKKGPGQLPDLLERAKKYAEKRGKDNPDYPFYIEERVKGLYHTAMNGYQDMQHGYENTIGRFILGANDGARVVSVDGLIGPKAPPEIRAAFNALEPAKQQTWLNRIRSLARGDVTLLTPAGILEEAKWRGMASDPERRAEFIGMGPGPILDSKDMPLSMKRSLVRLQETANTQAQNVQLNQAMSQLEPMLRSAGVWDNKDARSSFRGMLEDQLRDEQGKTKGKVPPEQVRKIGSSLLQKVGQTSFFGLFNIPGTGNELFRHLPSDLADEVRKELQDKGVNVTDTEIQRQVAYKLYKRLYEEKTKPAAPKGDKKPEASPDLQGLGQ